MARAQVAPNLIPAEQFNARVKALMESVGSTLVLKNQAEKKELFTLHNDRFVPKKTKDCCYCRQWCYNKLKHYYETHLT